MAAGPIRERHLRINPGVRALKRELGPLAWAVLEDVAFDATDEAGRMVAATSSRRVAENLGVTPGTAARALRRLRSAGLVAYARLDGAAGRFGLGVYVLTPPPGVEVLGATETAIPCLVRPCPGEPCVADRPRVKPKAVADNAPADRPAQAAAGRRAQTRRGLADTAERARIDQLSILDLTDNRDVEPTATQQP